MTAMMYPSGVKKKIVDGAVKILQNPECFCKHSWYTWIDPRSGSTTELNIEGEEGYEDLQTHLRMKGCTLNNPDFRVCGEGAIYVSAALQGYDYDSARTVIDEITSNGGCEIPRLNDAEDTSHMDVAEYIASYGDMEIDKGEL